ncbi:MAG: hypothetical protein CVV06_07475 [Gammaproteobacteria bacterium HGW-Gammaproteobacteria-10]|nr:MAG: hypothetical protein CVV06_07475 [Gammaproteobacteria bacterium HGW-Gammaproteobacteria-10]
MHFEVLVEDLSGKNALERLIPKIVGEKHTFRVLAYKGIGHVPKNMNSAADASKRKLLANLPRLLSGYGKAWNNYSGVVIVICDLDDKCLKSFLSQLQGILKSCDPRPETRFCIAIEEGEAWFLGDIAAIKKAYPKAKCSVLESYQADSICGTWEILADAVYPGGSRELIKQGQNKIGAEKSAWALKISPYMDIDRNCSPSFNYFVGKLKELSLSN